MHEVEHLGVGAVPVLRDAVLRQRLRCAAAALVESGEEALSGCDLLALHAVHAAILAASRPVGRLLRLNKSVRAAGQPGRAASR